MGKVSLMTTKMKFWSEPDMLNVRRVRRRAIPQNKKNWCVLRTLFFFLLLAINFQALIPVTLALEPTGISTITLTPVLFISISFVL